MPMSDNTELQRLMCLRRLGRQIAAGLPADLDHEQAIQVHEYVRELSAGAPKTHEQAAVEQGRCFERSWRAALANYHGPVKVCPPAAPPEADRGNELDLADDDEVDEDAVTRAPI